MPFDTLINDLLQQNAVDAARTADELCAAVQQDPALAEAFPTDYAITIFNRAKATAKSDLDWVFWLTAIFTLVNCAPRLVLPLLASDEPNASFQILPYLPEIGRAADPELQQQLIDALLALMNNPEPEMRVSGEFPIGGSLDLDSEDQRLKFRIAAADALIRVASDWGRCSLSKIASGLLATCEEPSSTCCARAAIFASAAIALDPAISFRCVSIGLNSADTGILKETGLAIVRCVSRIRHVWSESATHSIVDKLAHPSWIARKPLAEALLTLVEQGSQPPGADVYVLILRICESHEAFKTYRAAESQLYDVMGNLARLAREAGELDASVRSRLYEVIHYMLPTLETALVEDIALFTGDILQSGRYDVKKFRQAVDGTEGIVEFDSPDLWESHLTRLLDECLSIVEP